MHEPLFDAVQDALRDGHCTTRSLAAEAGLSYDLLRSWRSGRRRPTRESALRLSAALERRGERLIRAAHRIQHDAGPPAGA